MRAKRRGQRKGTRRKPWGATAFMASRGQRFGGGRGARVRGQEWNCRRKLV